MKVHALHYATNALPVFSIQDRSVLYKSGEILDQDLYVLK